MTDNDDGRPVSVRLGQVVPPEDPEDWRRPLTWVAAFGMLAGPLIAAAWFLLAPPTEASARYPATSLLGAAIAGGGVVTGVTQRGRWRAFGGTVGAALFAAVASIALAASLVPAGGPGSGASSAALPHAATAAIAGVAGAVAAGPLMAALATHPSRLRVAAVPLAVASAVAVLVVGLLVSEARQAAMAAPL